MKNGFRLGLAGLLALFFHLTYASAVQRELVPQAANGLGVQIVQSGPDGALLQVESSEPFPESEEQALPIYSSGMIWAVPPGTVSVTIMATPLAWRAPLQGEVKDSAAAQILAEPLPLARTSEVMHLRGIPLASLAFNAVQPNEDGSDVRICERYDVQIAYVSEDAAHDSRLITSSFYNLARGVAANLDDVLPEPLARPESYLVITRPAYSQTLTDLIHWKRARGHTVTVATTDVTGTTAAQILTYLQTAYNTWDEPPVFVLLIGDEDGTNSMPTWEVPGFYTATIASDHPYTLLDGSDFLPDVFIGRWSVDTDTELQTVINKCVDYEQQPFEPEGAWRSRMLITGVRSSANFYPTYNSSWPTLQWIGRQFLENGYSQIDSVPYPPGNASQINTRVNNGVSFIAYRGFGSPSDWAFPHYDLNDINALNNGEKLPVVMSIVCGGGAFSYQTDPCFGEKWLRLGTPDSPRGAVGFIGPSELDTKTRWNNTIIAGIFDGIVHEGVNTLAAAMLRGKLELVRQFPNNVDNHNADSDRSVSFYFKCYNLLGDPGQTFFVGPVRDLTANVPSSLPRGTSAVMITVNEEGTELSDVWCTVQAADTVFSRAISNASGELVLALPQSGEDSAVVTVTKPRHETQQLIITLPLQGIAIGASQTTMLDDGSNGSVGNGDGIANPSERLAINVRVRNFGSSNYGGGTLHFSSQSSEIQMADSLAVVPQLSAGAESAPLTFLADVAASANDGLAARLHASVDAGQNEWPLLITVQAPELLVGAVQSNGDSANPEPNATSAVALALSNLGGADAGSFSVTLRTLDTRISLLDSIANYPALPAGQSALPTDNGFEIAVGTFHPGDWAPVELIASNASFNTDVTYSLPIGNLQETDPTHPDDYGYRMFQDTDLGYAETPTYSWVEIDPARGGAGTFVAINDPSAGHDTSATIDLPFTFNFYGATYNQLTICSNGFVSFGDTDESYFRNYSLPAIASPDNMVCVFWDDLIMPAGSHICSYHDVTGGRFIIEWSRLANQYGTGLEETFELILLDTDCWPTRTGDGDIIMQYLALNNVDSWDNYATIGLQDRDLSYTLEITYANALAPGVSVLRSGQAFLFTTGRPMTGAYVSYSGNVVDDDSTGGSFGNSDGVPQNAETIQFQIELLNTGTETSPASTGILRSLDPVAVLLDSLMNFPVIEPGQEAVGNAVRLAISPVVSHGHSSNFLLSLTGETLPCVVLPSITISAPVLTLLPTIVDDDSIAPSNGNGNDEFNSGEIIELLPAATNLGGNAARAVQATLRRTGGPVVLIDTVALIGDISVNEERSAQDPFVLQVNTNVPDGSPVSLTLVLRDEYGNEWSSSLSYAIVQPLLAADGMRISDPAPGGDGNGRLVGGEAGELYPRVRNDGLGAATGVVVTLSTADSTVALQNNTVILGTVSARSTRESEVPILVSVLNDNPEPRNVQIEVQITADGGWQVNDVLILTIGDVQYYDDFESGGAGWSVFGTENWHLDTAEFHSPIHSFRTNGPADAYLRSPRFVFNGTGELLIWTRFVTDFPSDVCRVQLQIGPSTYFDLDVLSGNRPDWHQRQYSLSGYPASETAYIRFWFDADHSGGAQGCSVDDVTLTDEPVSAPGPRSNTIPDQVTLEQNYPNPFNNRTQISYSLPKAARVTIAIYDITGRRVAALIDGWKEAGTFKASWQPLHSASGIYFVRLETDEITLTRKIMLLK